MRTDAERHGRGTENADSEQRLVDFSPSHPELAPRHRDEFVQYLYSNDAAAGHKSSGGVGTEILGSKGVEEHIRIEEASIVYLLLHGRI